MVSGFLYLCSPGNGVASWNLESTWGAALWAHRISIVAAVTTIAGTTTATTAEATTTATMGNEGGLGRGASAEVCGSSRVSAP